MKFQIKEQAAIVLKKQKKHRIYVTAVSMACVLTIFGVFPTFWAWLQGDPACLHFTSLWIYYYFALSMPADNDSLH